MSDFSILGSLEQSFNTKPVSIVEFAESPLYCGRKLYPRQKLLLKLIFNEALDESEEAILDYWLAGGANGNEIEVCPGIREKREWLSANGYKHFREIVLVGGRRCSKGFITGLSMAKKVFDCIQLQDPNRYYGIDADKAIMFTCIAASQQQAQDMQYADFSAMVNSCQAIQRNIYSMKELGFSLMTEEDLRKMTDYKRQGRKVIKDISHIRGMAAAANARTMRGYATMVYVFDEFAHFMQGESDQSDKEIYAAATPSLAQFGRDAMIFCNSSPYSKTGTFYERFEAGMESGVNDEDGGSNAILSLRFPSWALFDGWWEDEKYVLDPDKPKKCITVSPDWDWQRKKLDEQGAETDDFFYTEDDRAAIITAKQEELDDPQKYKVERRGHFAETIDAYLIPEMVDRMFAGRPYEAHDEEGHPEIKYKQIYTNWIDATYQHQYVAHLDPSSTTAGFGFALGHVEYFNLHGRYEAHVVYDIIKRWNPKEYEDGVIDWEPILEEVLGYCGIFRPVQLTFDQHQSLWPMQWLKKRLRGMGIGETRVFEKTANMMANWNRAEVFRTACYRGLVHAPIDTADNAYAMLELKYLQEVKTGQTPRVEKQDEGPIQTKDMADCMMEVVEALIGSNMVNERDDLGSTGLRMGSPGGYPIGGQQGNSERAQAFKQLYSNRHGEQSFRDSRGGSSGGGNAARRPFGGRPLPRRLPGG